MSAGRPASRQVRAATFSWQEQQCSSPLSLLTTEFLFPLKHVETPCLWDSQVWQEKLKSLKGFTHNQGEATQSHNYKMRFQYGAFFAMKRCVGRWVVQWADSSADICLAVFWVPSPFTWVFEASPAAGGSWHHLLCLKGHWLFPRLQVLAELLSVSDTASCSLCSLLYTSMCCAVLIKHMCLWLDCSSSSVSWSWFLFNIWRALCRYQLSHCLTQG